MGCDYSKIQVEGDKTSQERKRIMAQDELINQLAKNEPIHSSHPEFAKATTNEERVAHVYAQFTKDKFVLNCNKTTAKTIKSAKKSKEHREAGNAAYQDMPSVLGLPIALAYFTKAITVAPFPTPEQPYATELAYAFGNRSAVMLARRQYPECLQDVEQALKYHNPDDHKVRAKLWRRGGEVLHIMGNLEEAMRYFKETEKAVLLSSKNVEQDLAPVRAQLAKIERGEGRPEVYLSKQERPPPQLAEGPNPLVPSLSRCVELEYDPKYGRLVRATRDIQPGEIILLEAPYVLVPTPEHARCDNCSAAYDSLLPCPTCHVVVYCSEKCRSESWRRSHELECPVLLALIEHAEQKTAVVLRTLMTALTTCGGAAGLRSFVRRLEANTQADGRIRGFNDDGRYETDYSAVHYLAHHSDRESARTLYECAAHSAFLLIHVGRHGGEALREEMRDEGLRRFVGGLIATYMMAGRVNSSSLQAYVPAPPRYANVGGVCLPVSSMTNHACNPNAFETYHGIVNVLRACRLIPKGEQVTIVYTGDTHGVTRSTEVRRDHLLYQHLFTCDCPLCTHEWPADCGERPFYWTCVACSATLPHGFGTRDGECGRCGAWNRASELVRIADELTARLTELLWRAQDGEDVRRHVYRHIADADKLETPQKDRLARLRMILVLGNVK